MKAGTQEQLEIFDLKRRVYEFCEDHKHLINTLPHPVGMLAKNGVRVRYYVDDILKRDNKDELIRLLVFLHKRIVLKKTKFKKKWYK